MLDAAHPILNGPTDGSVRVRVGGDQGPPHVLHDIDDSLYLFRAELGSLELVCGTSARGSKI